MYYVGAIPCHASDELAHFGTKGMKWGVRRYQNEDGSLTAEGKARYGYVEGSSVSTSKKALKRLEKERSQYAIQRGAARYNSAALLQKAAKQMEKAEEYDLKGKTKKRDKYTNKAYESLSKSQAANVKAKELETVMKTIGGEQWKHIGNLLANNVSVKSIEKSKFVMDRGSNAVAFMFGPAGTIPYGIYKSAKGESVGDYINTNKFKYGKGGQLTLENRTNPNIEQRSLSNRADEIERRLKDKYVR